MSFAVHVIEILLFVQTSMAYNFPSLATFPSFPSLDRFMANGQKGERSILEKPIPLGSPGVNINVPLGIGTWAWGNKLLWGYSPENDDDLQAAFNAAVDAGVTFFDTGDSYGTGSLEGRAETLLGKFRREYPDQKKAGSVVIGTKLATYPWRITAGSMEGALRASLDRINPPMPSSDDQSTSKTANSIELMQLHWSAANYAPWQEPGLRAGLVQCYEKGLAKAVGGSNYGPKQLRSLHDTLAQSGVPLATNQVQFSLLSRQPLLNGLFDTCVELGVVPIGYSPLALGLLSGRYTGDPAHDMPLLPKGPRGALFKQILPGVTPLLSTLKAVAEEEQKTIPQVAINWSICKGAVPIVGAKTAEQVKENLGAIGWRLSPAQVETLDAAAEKVPRQATQNIFQTD